MNESEIRELAKQIFAQHVRLGSNTSPALEVDMRKDAAVAFRAARAFAVRDRVEKDETDARRAAAKQNERVQYDP